MIYGTEESTESKLNTSWVLGQVGPSPGERQTPHLWGCTKILLFCALNCFLDLRLQDSLLSQPLLAPKTLRRSHTLTHTRFPASTWPAVGSGSTAGRPDRAEGMPGLMCVCVCVWIPPPTLSPCALGIFGFVFSGLGLQQRGVSLSTA